MFGDAFGDPRSLRLDLAREQMAELQDPFTASLSTCLAEGMPEWDRSIIADIVGRQILPKRVAFGPALTVGEIDDLPRLSAFSTAVGLMYWGDQTMVRGDLAMAQAIQLLESEDALPCAAISPLAVARLHGLQHIETQISRFAKPEDVPIVLDCFYNQVLIRESRVQQLSRDFLKTDSRPAFLAAHAEYFAHLMTVTAGLPSISSSLYAMYRHHTDILPSLPAVYKNPLMRNILQVCNVTVRIWDELGDWKMDSGAIPEKGVFTLNPCNQYHPSIVRYLCRLAGLQQPQKIAALQESFAAFHESDTSRLAHTERILGITLQHIRDYMAHVYSKVPQQFRHYFTLCKRVVEIGYVNRVGDIALADSEA